MGVMRLRDLLEALEAGTGTDGSAQAPQAPGPLGGPEGKAVDEGAGVAPLTPEQSRKRAEKRQRVQRRIDAEHDRHNDKLRSLRADMSKT